MQDEQQGKAIAALESIALAGIAEQRAKRRWRIFFIVAFLAMFAWFIVSVASQGPFPDAYDDFGQAVEQPVKEHIALIDLQGEISAQSIANAEDFTKVLRSASNNDLVHGILVRADSPGGSPVQSSLMYKAIQEVQEHTDKRIVTVITDTCASGCYFAAAASDAIYADKSSVVGSIGVISQWMGYQQAAEKLGIQLQTFTAGENKAFLDPSRKPTEKEIAYLKTLLSDLHQHFIDAVKSGRGEVLSDDKELFSGRFWTGEKALELGLIDGIKTPLEAAQSIGDYPVYNYSQQSKLEEALKTFGASAQTAISQGVKNVFSSSGELELR